MNRLLMHKRCFFLTISIFWLPVTVIAGGSHADNDNNAEIEMEIDYFNIGSSKSNTANSEMATSGVMFESQYEKNNTTFSFGYERWNYRWTNPENLPFGSGVARDPWGPFTTLQFGFAYEQEPRKNWELRYYLEAESSYEKEMSNSYEYEAGIDFNYEPSHNWSYTLNVNLEYLDADGAELGVDFEIEWNHHAKEGWSGEFEISSEFPESLLRYHFTKEFATAVYYGEGGTNTIRLSDNSTLPGLKGAYLEDEYTTFGLRLDYEFAPEQLLSFSLQKNTGRQLSFSGPKGGTEKIYKFDDSTEFLVKYSHSF